ncbi:MAG: DUF819 family protein [Halieaceae bacterium]|jgi:uncharacterized membrane protein|nr:DUF819 family protein [Halieaceae bacterium]MBT7339875.1 DUF819 family protein [Halieaceae bacterium]MDG2138049.1 DUF819 family protein [Luminiphilus sp.]
MLAINPENHLGIFAAIMVLAGASFLLERTRLGRQLTGTVMVILAAIVAANLGIIPHSAPTYDFIFTFLVPMLIPLFLFQADLRRLWREASRTTLAFLVATIGTVAGIVVAATLLDLSTLGSGAPLPASDREAAIVGLFASTYIGGSVNYAALGEMTGLNQDRSFFSAATAADNLFSAVYLSLIALLPGVTRLARFFPAHPTTPQPTTAPEAAPPQVTARSLCLAIACAAALVAISDGLVAYLNAVSYRYVTLTILTLMLATLVPAIREWLAGAFELGVALSFAFFAAIAAGANLTAMVSVAPTLIVVVLILLSVHLATLLFIGAVTRLTLPELLTASNAAILGATTAPAMAAAKGWRDQVTPGVLVGVLGYALGTFIGSALYNLW